VSKTSERGRKREGEAQRIKQIVLGKDCVAKEEEGKNTWKKKLVFAERKLALPQLILCIYDVLALCKHQTSRRRLKNTETATSCEVRTRSPVIKAERTFWASAKVIPAQSPE
jgi:hypothetical protein